MSLRGNIEHIVHSNGIEAALVRVEEQPDTFSGSEEWNETLATALDVFRLSEQSSVRIVVGKHTLVVQQERGEQVAVALPTGHPMAKSLRRMLRRMARKDRGPLASAAVGRGFARVATTNLLPRRRNFLLVASWRCDCAP